MKPFRNYIDSLLSKGKRYFSRDQALEELNISSAALTKALSRLKKRGEIISPAKNLYTILSPEYRTMGSLPPAEVIVILMKFKKCNYYAALLTASMYHGASHQKPQIFQVISDKRFKDLTLGKIRIVFIYKKNMKDLPIENHVVESGYLNISSPELTVLDILSYPTHSGGLNNIATILVELIEKVDGSKLVNLIKNMNAKLYAQRLGYILDMINDGDAHLSDITKALQMYLSAEKIYYVPLSPDLSIKGVVYNAKWKIIENNTIESDL